MRAIKLCALAGVVALVAVACQSAPEDTVNATVDEAGAGSTAAGNAAAGTETGATADTAGSPEATASGAEAPATEPRQRRERPQPEAPRAEGDGLAELLASGDFLLLDVRRPEELEELGTVEGYLNIPIEELADRLEEVPRDRPILTA